MWDRIYVTNIYVYTFSVQVWCAYFSRIELFLFSFSMSIYYASHMIHKLYYSIHNFGL